MILSCILTPLIKGHLFFSPFSVVRPTQIFGVFKKNKRNDLVKPFFIWNNSLNRKNERSNKTGTKTGTFFTVSPRPAMVLCILLIQIMWMLTFNVVLGYQGILFQDFLWIFFLGFFFFQSDRPTQYQETHSIDAKRKKKGDGLSVIWVL